MVGKSISGGNYIKFSTKGDLMKDLVFNKFLSFKLLSRIRIKMKVHNIMILIKLKDFHKEISFLILLFFLILK